MTKYSDRESDPDTCNGWSLLRSRIPELGKCTVKQTFPALVLLISLSCGSPAYRLQWRIWMCIKICSLGRTVDFLFGMVVLAVVDTKLKFVMLVMCSTHTSPIQYLSVKFNCNLIAVRGNSIASSVRCGDTQTRNTHHGVNVPDNRRANATPPHPNCFGVPASTIRERRILPKLKIDAHGRGVCHASLSLMHAKPIHVLNSRDTDPLLGYWPLECNIFRVFPGIGTLKRCMTWG